MIQRCLPGTHDVIRGTAAWLPCERDNISPSRHSSTVLQHCFCLQKSRAVCCGSALASNASMTSRSARLTSWLAGQGRPAWVAGSSSLCIWRSLLRSVVTLCSSACTMHIAHPVRCRMHPTRQCDWHWCRLRVDTQYACSTAVVAANSWEQLPSRQGIKLIRSKLNITMGQPLHTPRPPVCCKPRPLEVLRTATVAMIAHLLCALWMHNAHLEPLNPLLTSASGQADGVLLLCAVAATGLPGHAHPPCRPAAQPAARRGTQGPGCRCTRQRTGCRGQCSW